MPVIIEWMKSPQRHGFITALCQIQMDWSASHHIYDIQSTRVLYMLDCRSNSKLTAFFLALFDGLSMYCTTALMTYILLLCQHAIKCMQAIISKMLSSTKLGLCRQWRNWTHLLEHSGSFHAGRGCIAPLQVTTPIDCVRVRDIRCLVWHVCESEGDSTKLQELSDWALRIGGLTHGTKVQTPRLTAKPYSSYALTCKSRCVAGSRVCHGFASVCCVGCPRVLFQALLCRHMLCHWLCAERMYCICNRPQTWA